MVAGWAVEGSVVAVWVKEVMAVVEGLADEVVKGMGALATLAAAAAAVAEGMKEVMVAAAEGVLSFRSQVRGFAKK